MNRSKINQALSTPNIFLAALFLGLFAMAARNVTDPDIWWHLKTGQYIAEQGSVPRTDPFSFTRAGQTWVTHEWLSEVLLFWIYRTAGWGGLIVIFSATVAAAFFFLFMRCGPAPYVGGLATLGASWATAPIWGVRPQVISLLLTSLWLLLLERSENNPNLLWWTLPLTLLWVNLHAGFALGLALLALFLAGRWLERGLGWSSLQNARWTRTAALILFLDLLLVPVNPSGLRLFSYPMVTLRSAAMQKYIAEWASPNFHQWEYWPLLGVVLGTFATLRCSKQRVRPRDLLLLLVGLYAGLCSIRLIPLFVFIAVPLMATRLGNWPKRRPDGTPVSPTIRAVVNSIIVCAMASFTGMHLAHVIQHQTQVEAQHFPVGAVRFLAANSFPRPIFNHYDWGGYLVWQLSPSVPVFIDGRADLYENRLLDEFAETYQFKADWRQTLERWGIGTVLVPRDSALATGLRSSSGWSVSYEDRQAMVLIRAAPRPVEERTPGIIHWAKPDE